MFKESKNLGYKILTVLVAFLIANQCAMSVASNANLNGSASILDINTAKPKTEENLKLKNSNNITNSQKKITISLRESDIKQVLRMIADKAGMNILFHESVGDKKVTLDLKNVTLDEAFNYVLLTGELNYYVEDQTIVVAAADASQKSGFARQYLTTFPIKYVNASNIASFLNDNVYSSGLKGVSESKIATSNPRTNEVMIFGTKTDADIARKVIAKLDTKPMMTNFKVVHTTPKQMADFICKSLFADQESPGGQDKLDNGGDVLEFAIGGGSIACKAKVEDGGEGSAVFKAMPATIIYMEQAGEVGVYGGSYEQTKLVEEFIKKHDKKQTMALIELNIVELNEDGSDTFNASWHISTPFAFMEFTSGNGLQIGDRIPTKIDEKTGRATEFAWDRITVLSIKDNAWHPLITNNGGVSAGMTISKLIRDGKGRTVANPKILATNGQKSTIDLTSDYISKVTTQMTTTTAQAVVTRNYDIANDNGIKIEITPFISPAGYVSMNIKPEYATIKQQIHAAGQSGEEGDLVATLLQRRDLELNNIRIKDGETLVLAGFVGESETQDSVKFPGLADLPLVGALFRSSGKTISKQETIIMITPHIIYGDEHYQTTNNTNVNVKL